VGSPYLWGGLSSKGMDCSGLVRMAYMAQGRLLSRDARDQILEGEAVDRDSLMAGDLIFFGNPSTGSVTHVGIYRGGGEYVHSSQLVRVNSLSEDSPLYLPLRVVGFRRVSGVPLSELPEYF
ncbi:MAG: C40 family peptidase, partial [Muribaculaceae bacterium]|nr:C40 family peptidase [Muribaculaceae bacterium]